MVPGIAGPRSWGGRWSRCDGPVGPLCRAARRPDQRLSREDPGAAGRPEGEEEREERWMLRVVWSRVLSPWEYVDERGSRQTRDRPRWGAAGLPRFLFRGLSGGCGCGVHGVLLMAGPQLRGDPHEALCSIGWDSWEPRNWSKIICAGGVVSTLSAGGIELITISEPLLDGVE